MIRITPLASLSTQPRAMALGNFDGLHLGHRQLLTHTIETARSMKLSSGALVFEPHPQEVLNPGRALRLITLPKDRATLMDELGLEELIIASFDQAFSRLSPREFVEEILVDRCQVKAVCVGEGYRFGASGQGDVALLRAFGAQHGFEVHELPLLKRCGEIISSSAIREALAKGDLRKANDLLGHPYTLCSVVEHGSALATSLGFPTANLAVSPRCLLPRYGVYTGEATVCDQAYHCLVNIGVRPSVGASKAAVEAHLLNFNGNLYGENLCLRLMRFVRTEQHFASLEELQRQVLRDIDGLRRALAEENGRRRNEE